MVITVLLQVLSSIFYGKAALVVVKQVMAGRGHAGQGKEVARGWAGPVQARRG